MTTEIRQKRWRWLRHLAWILAAKAFLALLVLIGIAIFFGSGAGNPMIHGYIVHRLESFTGGPVTLKSLSIRWLSLEFKLQGLVIHGQEPAGTEPFFAADQIDVGLRIDSVWGRKVSLSELTIQRPQIHLRIENNGKSNLPVSQRSTTKTPVQQRLFDLRIGRLQLQNGWILYNDVRAPLALQGDSLRLALDASGSPEHPLYLGTLDWHSFDFTAKRFIPWPVSISAKFTL